MLVFIKNLFKVEFHQDRIYGLDLIRAIAIISVLLGHGSHIITGEEGSLYYHAFTFLDGVFVFFVLSGFLIGGLLIYILENKQINASTLFQFWRRRLLRTLPAYYLILIVLTILSLLYASNFKISDSYRYYFLVQNFDRSHPFFFAEAWTLSIEVWFYIFIPLFIFIFKGFFKMSDKISIITAVIMFLALGFSVRLMRMGLPGLNGEAVDHLFRKQVLTRIDSVTMGVVGAYVYHYHKEFWLKFKNQFLILGLLIFLYTKYPLFNHGNFYNLAMFYTLQSFSFLLIIPFFNEIKTGKGLFFRIMTVLSYVSFSIYLLNMNVVQVFILNRVDFGNLNDIYVNIIKYVLYLLLSVFGGILMYKFVELPFMKLRRSK